MPIITKLRKSQKQKGFREGKVFSNGVRVRVTLTQEQALVHTTLSFCSKHFFIGLRERS